MNTAHLFDTLASHHAARAVREAHRAGGLDSGQRKEVWFRFACMLCRHSDYCEW